MAKGKAKTEATENADSSATESKSLKGSDVSFTNEAGKHTAKVLEVYNDNSVKLQVGTVEEGYFIEDNVKLSEDGAIGTYSII